MERVIGRLKQFKLLSNKIPVHLVHSISDIMTICGAIVNLSAPVLAAGKFVIK